MDDLREPAAQIYLNYDITMIRAVKVPVTPLSTTRLAIKRSGTRWMLLLGKLAMSYILSSIMQLVMLATAFKTVRSYKRR